MVDESDDGGAGEPGNGGEAIGDAQQNAGVLRGDVQMVAVEPGEVGAVEAGGADEQDDGEQLVASDVGQSQQRQRRHAKPRDRHQLSHRRRGQVVLP